MLYVKALTQAHISEMDFTGKSMKGIIYVSADGIANDKDLHFWIDRYSDYALSLPPKSVKNQKKK